MFDHDFDQEFELTCLQNSRRFARNGRLARRRRKMHERLTKIVRDKLNNKLNKELMANKVTNIRFQTKVINKMVVVLHFLQLVTKLQMLKVKVSMVNNQVVWSIPKVVAICNIQATIQTLHTLNKVKFINNVSFVAHQDPSITDIRCRKPKRPLLKQMVVNFLGG